MKVYRGPSSKPFYDKAHESVSHITADQLEDGIKSNSLIQFNITKDGPERQAVCTVRFEESDIVPMVRGLLVRLQNGQECLAEIKNTLNDKELSEKAKIAAIKKALRSSR